MRATCAACRENSFGWGHFWFTLSSGQTYIGRSLYSCIHVCWHLFIYQSNELTRCKPMSQPEDEALFWVSHQFDAATYIPTPASTALTQNATVNINGCERIYNLMPGGRGPLLEVWCLPSTELLGNFTRALWGAVLCHLQYTLHLYFLINRAAWQLPQHDLRNTNLQRKPSLVHGFNDLFKEIFRC